MKKTKIFISSVQSEFIAERQMLYDYLTTDALLGKFFEPFMFEKLPATGQNSNQVYLNEILDFRSFENFGSLFTSNGSVQIMLFKDRLEICNPGSLPYGLTAAKLRVSHHSIPANPLLAEPMYLAGYIERMGTGTGDIISLCKKTGLKEPEFIQEDIFKVIIWKKAVIDGTTEYDTEYDTIYDTDHVEDLVKKMVDVMSGEMSRQELQELLGIKNAPHFMNGYLTPALKIGVIEMTLQDKIKSKNQKYRLTSKGVSLQKRVKQ